MENALEDFMHHCRIERRLAPLTCSAYERDVTAWWVGIGVSGRPASLSAAPRRPAWTGPVIIAERGRSTMKEGTR
jgi:hypothetical protein